MYLELKDGSNSFSYKAAGMMLNLYQLIFLKQRAVEMLAHLSQLTTFPYWLNPNKPCKIFVY